MHFWLPIWHRKKKERTRKGGGLSEEKQQNSGKKEEGESLADYLSKRVFGGQEGVTEDPVPADVEGFDRFLKRYNEGLAIERAAVEHL